MKIRRFFTLFLVVCLLFAFCVSAYAQEYTVSSVQELVSVIRECARQGLTSFSVSCNESTYNLLRADNDEPFRNAIHQGGMKSYGDCGIVRYGSVYTFSFSSVNYYTRYTVCSSMSDVENAIGMYKQNGAPSFALVCSADVYRTVSSKDGSAFWQMLHLHGIDNAEVSYGNSVYEFRNVSYSDNYYYCRTAADLENAIFSCAQDQLSSFRLICSEDLYRRMKANGSSLLCALCSFYGIYPASSSSDDGCTFYFDGDIYYPGYRVWRMYAMGRESELTGEERRLLDRAKQIVNSIGPGHTLLEKERILHDRLCDAVTYYEHGTKGRSVYDTAVGALLYGMADCDGYADSFYLLCSLAGIPVCMISGDAITDETSSGRYSGEGGHAWNLISPDRGANWYMVDVTWDDAGGDCIDYIWFNTGKALASYSHIWEEDAIPVNWALYENDSVNYYGGNFEGRSFASPREAASCLLRSMSGNRATLNVKLSGAFDSGEINKTICDAIEKSDIYGNWSYGCVTHKIIGNVTFAVINAEVR